MLVFSGFCLALVVSPLSAELPSEIHHAEPTPKTEQENETLNGTLLHTDQDDFADAQRGWLAPLSPLRIEKCQEVEGLENPLCTAIWDLGKYDFLNPNIGLTDVPDPAWTADDFPWTETTINPSLWRNAVLNTFHGVFEVKPGIYQVRGYDLSNMSAIQGDNGWIIVDPLTTEETAAEAMRNLNRVVQPTNETVSAVIFTHSHVDHFGGVKGLETFLNTDAKIFAPEGFLDEAVSENVTVGNAMGRRATYMYGPLLDKGPKGQVDGGLGKTTPAGTTGILEPDCVVGTGTLEGTGCPTRDTSSAWHGMTDLFPTTIDGVKVVFQNVPGSEAPAEMLFYFPDHLALCASEDVTHTFHNVLTLRGANVRDSLLWAKYLDQTIKSFATEDDPTHADVIFASHHWPTWDDNEGRVTELIELQRDLYRYIHDQTVRLTNLGYTIQEVGEYIQLPDVLGKRWFNRGYYGTVNHNAKAVYQRYIGWFDGNPASLHQLPPAQAAEKYMHYMTNTSTTFKEKVDTDYDNGEYRWVATVLSHKIFDSAEDIHADSGGCLGRNMTPGDLQDLCLKLADTFDQLGYQAESGPWRNFYLTGAMELRYGVLPLPAVKTFTRDTVEAMTLEMIFDFFAVHLDGYTAGQQELDYTYLIDFWQPNGVANTGQEAMDSVLYLKNGVLNYDIDVDSATLTADATLHMTRSFLDTLVMGEVEGTPLCSGNPAPEDPGTEDCIVVTDDLNAATQLHQLLGSFDFWFNIVSPNEAP